MGDSCTARTGAVRVGSGSIGIIGRLNCRDDVRLNPPRGSRSLLAGLGFRRTALKPPESVIDDRP